MQVWLGAGSLDAPRGLLTGRYATCHPVFWQMDGDNGGRGSSLSSSDLVFVCDRVVCMERVFGRTRVWEDFEGKGRAEERARNGWDGLGKCNLPVRVGPSLVWLRGR